MPDYATKLLLHLNGADGQESTVDSSYYDRPVTFYDHAQLDTAWKVFGTASLWVDGSVDRISMPDSFAWSFGDGDFTIDFRIRWDGTTGNSGIIGQSEGPGHNVRKWALYWNAVTPGKLTLLRDRAVGEGRDDVEWSWTPLANAWYHLAIVRSGNSWYLFVDGVQTGGTQTESNIMPSVADDLNIGACGELWQYFRGWLDEFRIRKSVAQWTSNFTPPTSEYDYTDFEDVSSTITGVSTVSGVLINHNAVAGAITTQSSITGTLIAALPITGAVATQSSVTGSVTVLPLLVGTVTTQSTVNGHLAELGLSNYSENKILDHVVGKASFSKPTAWLGLCDADPMDAGTGADCSEIDDANNYARVETSGATWNVAAAGAISNALDIVFPVAAGTWGIVTHFALFDSGVHGQGNMLIHDELDAAKNIVIGDTLRFAVGALVITLN